MAAAHELEHALPYQPIIEALRGLMAQPDWPTRRSRLQLAEVWRKEVARLVPEFSDTAASDHYMSRVCGKGCASS